MVHDIEFWEIDEKYFQVIDLATETESNKENQIDYNNNNQKLDEDLEENAWVVDKEQFQVIDPTVERISSEEEHQTTDQELDKDHEENFLETGREIHDWCKDEK